MKRITRTMRDYWAAFRSDRFDKKALWQFFQGQYIHAGGQDPFPREDFVNWAGVNRYSWIEAAPGPRGGEGWRLTPQCIALLESEETARSERYESACQLISSSVVKYGSLEIFEQTYGRGDYVIHWIFKPPVPVPGPDIGGRQRHEGDPFVSSVPWDITDQHLAQMLAGWFRHVEELMISHEERLRTEAERLAALISTAKRL